MDEKLIEINEQWIEQIVKMLREPNARVVLMRGFDWVGVEDGWKVHAPKSTSYLFISIGPTDAEIENVIKSALGFDPIHFTKG